MLHSSTYRPPEFFEVVLAYAGTTYPYRVGLGTPDSRHDVNEMTAVRLARRHAGQHGVPHDAFTVLSVTPVAARGGTPLTLNYRS